MKALVTGAAGMLGRAAVAAGRERGHEVVGLGKGELDVTDASAVAARVAEVRPEAIFNCAAFTRVDDCESEREAAFAVNAEAVGHLARAAREARARLVHVSTDYVFDGTAAEPYGEDAPTGPRSVYGESKLAGERRAFEAGGDLLVVRSSWLFGPGGGNFVATMARLVGEGRRELRVVDDQEGRPTYTPFLARALFELAERGAGGVVHYGNSPPVTWYGLTRAIVGRLEGRLEGLGEVEVVPVTTAEFPRPAERPAYSVFDVSRFEALAGRPVEGWEAGLDEYLGMLVAAEAGEPVAASAAADGPAAAGERRAGR